MLVGVTQLKVKVEIAKVKKLELDKSQKPELKQPDFAR